MGAAASTVLPRRARPSAPAAPSAGPPTADPVPERTSPLIVVEGRYYPYPGQADPFVQWVPETPRTAEARPSSGDAVGAATSTPHALTAVEPTQAEPIPYTPEGGYPPDAQVLTWRRVPVAATITMSPSTTCAQAAETELHATAPALSSEAENDSAAVAQQALALSTVQTANVLAADGNAVDGVTSLLPSTADSGAANAGAPLSEAESCVGLQGGIDAGFQVSLLARPVSHAVEDSPGTTRVDAATEDSASVEHVTEETAEGALEINRGDDQYADDAWRNSSASVVGAIATTNLEQTTRAAAAATRALTTEPDGTTTTIGMTETEIAIASAPAPAPAPAVVPTAETLGAASASAVATSTAAVVLPPLQRTHGFQAAFAPSQTHDSVPAASGSVPCSVESNASSSSSSMPDNDANTTQLLVRRPSLLPLHLPLPLCRDSSGSVCGPDESEAVLNTGRSAASSSNAFGTLSARSVGFHCSIGSSSRPESSRRNQEHGNTSRSSGASVDTCDWLNRGLLAAMTPRPTPRPSVAVTPRGVAALDQLEQICRANLPNQVPNAGSSEHYSASTTNSVSSSSSGGLRRGHGGIGTTASIDAAISPWVSPAPSPRLNHRETGGTSRAEARSESAQLGATSNETTLNTSAAQVDDNNSLSFPEHSLAGSSSRSNSWDGSSSCSSSNDRSSYSVVSSTSNASNASSLNATTTEPCRVRPPQHPPPRAPKRPSLRPSQPTRQRPSHPARQHQHRYSDAAPQQFLQHQRPAQPQRQNYHDLVAPEPSPRASVHVLVHPEVDADADASTSAHAEEAPPNPARPPLQAISANVFNLMMRPEESHANLENPSCGSDFALASTNHDISTGLRDSACGRDIHERTSFVQM